MVKAWEFAGARVGVEEIKESRLRIPVTFGQEQRETRPGQSSRGTGAFIHFNRLTVHLTGLQGMSAGVSALFHAPSGAVGQ